MMAMLKLWGDLALGDPAFLGLLVFPPLLWFWRRSRRARPALLWGSFHGRSFSARGMRARFSRLPLLLEVLALTLLILALARPQRILERVENVTKGVDIILCLDVSSSMNQPDLDPEERKSRLEIAKEVADRFIAGRKGDRVGLVSFARFPRILCPPTLDLDAARGFLKGVKCVEVKEEDGTGYGAGLARSIALLHQSKAKSKVVILLTDGQENINRIKPLDAARAAKQFKVRVHTMATGKYVIFQGPFGRHIRQEMRIDTRDLEKIAKDTGGRFFRPLDDKGLDRVWADIDKMEKSELKDRRWVDAKDLAGLWILTGACLLLAALLGIALGGLP